MPKFTDASQREFHSRHQRGVDALPYPLTPAPNHDPVPTNRHREPIYQTEAGRVWRWMHDDPTTASPPPPGLGTGFPPNIYAAAGFDSHLNPQANDYNDFYRQRPYHHAPEFPTAGISSSSRLDPRYGYPPECTPSSYGSFTRHLAEEEPVTTPVIPFNLFPEVNQRGTPFDTSADVQSTPPEEIFTAQTDPNARIRSNPPPGHWDPIIQDDSDSSTYSILLAPVPDIPGHTEHIHVSEVHVFCEVLCDSPSTIRTEDLFRAEQLKQAEPQHRPGYQPPSRDQPHPSAHAGPDQGPSPNVAINIIPPTNSSDSRSTPKSSLGSKKQSDESGDIKIAEPLSPKVSNRPGTPRPNEQLATTRTPPRLNPSNLASGYLSSPFSSTAVASSSEYEGSPASKGKGKAPLGMGNASFSSATTAFQAAVSSSENEGTPASKGRPPLRMHNAPLKTAVVHDGFSPATATSGYLASDDEQRLPPWVKAKAGDRSHSQQAKKTLPTELPQPSTSTPIQNSTRPSNYHYKVEAQISQLTDNMAKEPRQSDLFALIYKCTTSLDRLHLRAQGNAHAHEAVTALGRALEALSASISQCKEDEGNEEGWQWIENHEDLFYSLQRNLFKIYTLTLDSTTFELDRLQAYEEKLQSLTKKLNKSHYRLTLQRLRSRLRAEHETAREEARDEEMRRAEFRIKWEEGKATRAALRRELAIIDMEKAPEARSERPRRRTRGKGDV